MGGDAGSFGRFGASGVDEAAGLVGDGDTYCAAAAVDGVDVDRQGFAGEDEFRTSTHAAAS
jgi:hypothetical protein